MVLRPVGSLFLQHVEHLPFFLNLLPPNDNFPLFSGCRPRIFPCDNASYFTTGKNTFQLPHPHDSRRRVSVESHIPSTLHKSLGGGAVMQLTRSFLEFFLVQLLHILGDYVAGTVGPLRTAIRVSEL